MLFIVESILERKEDSVLVKWEGYKSPTWEPLSNMPVFIQHFVDKKGGGKIPDPVVKHKKNVDGNIHVMLEWLTETGEKDIMWQKVAETEDDIFKCDTRKDKDKRICRHSFGINIACWPCGVVVMFKELFGSEGASQVYAQVTEWMATLPDGKLRKLKWLLYDDMCHLGEEPTVCFIIAYAFKLQGHFLRERKTFRIPLEDFLPLKIWRLISCIY